jgi:hypothetical protein
MADTKITALTAISTVDPAVDVLPIVDVSDTTMAASGTTKKITSNQILGAGGTATLASATITGDLTVDTSTLKVDSVNNRVGIGTASPLNALHVLGSTTGNVGRIVGGGSGQPLFLYSDNSGSGVNNGSNGSYGTGLYFSNASNFLAFYTDTGSGGTEKARIDSTGNVGIGVAPSAWNTAYKALQVGGGAALFNNAAGSNSAWLTSNFFFNSSNANTFIGTGYALMYRQVSGEHAWLTSTASGTAGGAATMTQMMTLDASGNLLVGKTASSSTVVGAELRPSGAIISTLAASTNADFALYTYSTGAGAARFYVGMSGTVFATNTTISAISDQRLKENVQDIDVGLGAILALKPRKFDWKDGKGKDIKGDRGFIAQEFEQVFPQLVDEWADPAPEGEAPYKSVRQDLIPVLVKAIQELAAEVNALKNA